MSNKTGLAVCRCAVTVYSHDVDLIGCGPVFLAETFNTSQVAGMVGRKIQQAVICNPPIDLSPGVRLNFSNGRACQPLRWQLKGIFDSSSVVCRFP